VDSRLGDWTRYRKRKTHGGKKKSDLSRDRSNRGGRVSVPAWMEDRQSKNHPETWAMKVARC